MANEIMLGDLNLATADPRVAVVDGSRTAESIISAVGSIGGDIIQGVQTGRTTRAIEDEAETFQATRDLISRGMTYDPERDTLRRSVKEGDATVTYDVDIDGEEKEALLEASRAAYGRSAEVFKRYMTYTDQKGGDYMASRHARTRMEGELKRIINQTPGFEDAIRQAATDVLGYSPTGWAVRQILDVDKPSERAEELTPVQKTMAVIREAREAMGMPLPESDIAEMAGQIHYREQQSLLYKGLTDTGNFELSDVVSHYASIEPVELNQALYRLVISNEDGLLTADMQREATSLIDGWVESQVSAAIADARKNPNIRLTAADIADIRNVIQDRAAGYKLTMENNSMFNVYTKQLEERGVQAKDFWFRNAPGISLIANGLPESIAATVIDTLYGPGISNEQARNTLMKVPGFRDNFIKDPKLLPSTFIDDSAKVAFGLGEARALPADPGVPGAKSTTEKDMTDYTTVTTIETGDKLTTREDKSAYVKALAPRYALAVAASGVSKGNFDKLDKEARDKIVDLNNQEMMGITDLFSDFFNPTTHLSGMYDSSGRSLKVDPETGKISVVVTPPPMPTATGEWVQQEPRDVTATLPGNMVKAVRTYNNMQARFFADDKWRGAMIRKPTASAAEATQLVLDNAQYRHLQKSVETDRARLQSVQDERDVEIGRRVSKGEDADKAREAVEKKYSSRLESLQSSLDESEGLMDTVRRRIVGAPQ